MPEEVTYTEVIAGSSLYRPVGLCELADRYRGGAGLYVVEELTGVREFRPEGEGISAQIYAELTLLDEWIDSPPNQVIVRISGGPTGRFVRGKEVQSSSAISLRVGEIVGVLLDTPNAMNFGFHRIDPIGVFRLNEQQKLVGEQLFSVGISPAELRELLKQVRDRKGSNVCAGLKPPESFRAPEPAREIDIVEQRASLNRAIEE